MQEVVNHFLFTIFSRNQGSGRQENEQEKYVRLFVIVPKDMSEDDLRIEFEKYGEVENISVIKDKVTKERKGFAYVKYAKSVENSFPDDRSFNTISTLPFQIFPCSRGI